MSRRPPKPPLFPNTPLSRSEGGPAMKLGLINSAWAQAGRETGYGIRMTREIGFDTIDIFTDPLDIDVKERRLIKRECDKRSEEHTSELQSQSNLVCRLLLEK